MKILCYAFKSENGELESPFLEYLQKYALQECSTIKNRNLRMKQLANLEKHLQYLLQNEGKYDLPPLVQKYRGRNIGILKIKESRKLLRIAFFTKLKDGIILLQVIDKPKLSKRLTRGE